MGRPLTGTKTHNNSGYSFACPPKRGSRQRRQATFTTEAERDAFADAALHALQAGQPLPDADAFRSPLATAALRDTSFKAVADAWYEQHYGTLRRAGAERAVAVRRLLDDPVIPYFHARVQSVENLTQDLVIGFYADFRKPTRPARSATAVTDPAWDKAEVTLADAAGLCGLSLSTIKRAVGPAGRLSARRDPLLGVRVVRVADLAAAGLLATGRPQGKTRSVGYARLAIDTIKGICRYARANGLDVPNITDGLRLVDNEPRQPQRALTWNECRRLAGHLHPVWQIAFWLMRSTGLRISEAFGLRVEDVLDLADGGLIDVFRQGGKPFHAYGDDGHIIRVPDKATPKTAASIRLIVACEPVLAMLRVAVDAFHTDPETGLVDGQARLIPGLANPDRGGQAGFRAALAAAAVAEGLDSDTLEFRVSSHLLRKSLTTELGWDTTLQEGAKRLYVGQRAADDVYGRTYTLNHPDLAPTRAVAHAVTSDIQTCLGGSLLTPTARRFHFRAGNPLRSRTGHVWAVLDDAGWTAQPDEPDDPLLDAHALAAELAVSATTARRWMRTGTVPSVPITTPGQPVTRHARLSDIQALRDQQAATTRLPDLAASLKLGYHEARTIVQRLNLHPRRAQGTGEFLLDNAEATAVRAEADRLAALHARSVRIATAAVDIGTGVATINVLIRSGALTLDHDTDPSGAKYVTRTSIAAEKARRASRVPARQVPRADAAVTLGQARAVTGLTEGMLLALAASRHLDRCYTRTRSWAVTHESLVRWAVAYRPDLLPRL